MSSLATSSQHGNESPSLTIRQKKKREKEGTQIGEEDVKLSLFVEDDIILYIEIPKYYTHTHAHTQTHAYMTFRTNKQIQQRCRTQNQHKYISCLSIH